MMYRITTLTICLLLTLQLTAQKEDDKKWDVNNPPGDTSVVTITTDEGTFMNHEGIYYSGF